MFATTLIQSAIQRYSPIQVQNSSKPKKTSQWKRNNKQQRIKTVNQQPLLNKWAKQAYLAREPFPYLRWHTLIRDELTDLLFGSSIQKFADFLNKEQHIWDIIDYVTLCLEKEISPNQVKLQTVNDNQFVICELSYEYWFDEYYTRQKGIQEPLICFFPSYGNEIYDRTAEKIAQWEKEIINHNNTQCVNS